jgi:5-methylcytosine-specific restriction endonuclease McrA
MIIKTFKPQTTGTKLVSDTAKMVRRHRANTQHRNIVADYRAAYPLCLRCLLDRRLTPADEIHHIHAVRDGGATTDENLLALCRRCHVTIDKVDRAEQLNIKTTGETAYNEG